jgi:hypothetical protein
MVQGRALTLSSIKELMLSIADIPNINAGLSDGVKN